MAAAYGGKKTDGQTSTSTQLVIVIKNRQIKNNNKKTENKQQAKSTRESMTIPRSRQVRKVKISVNFSYT